MMEFDGWEILSVPPPLRPGEYGQHTNGPADWWVRKNGDEWRRLSWKSIIALKRFYAAFGRWPEDHEDESVAR